ncbi:hypothetical protein QFZ97_008203 [Paraburkholderia youngii]
MNPRHHAHELARPIVLERMEVSRTALVVANRTVALPAAPTGPRSSSSNVLAALAEAPRVALLLALVVGAIALRSRRKVTIAGRAGATAWIARNVRRSVGF